MTGLAIAPKGDALYYDLGERLGLDENFPDSKALYDGYIEQEYTVRGDIWVGIDIVLQVPKLFQNILGQGNPFQNMICSPQPGVPNPSGDKFKENKKKIPKVTIQGSLFLSNVIDYSPDEEFVALIAVEEVSIKLPILTDFKLGSAFALIRQNSKKPDCFPSGFFASVFLGTDWGLGEGIRAFLNIPESPTARADIGIAWLDNPLPDNKADFISSVFLRG